MWFYRSTTKVPEASLVAVPLTSYPGEERQPSFSPDGNQVAFSWNGEKQDNFDIYVKLIGSGAQRRLTTAPEADSSPAWSPDGSSIAFVREGPGGKASVYLVSPLGPPERRVAEISRTGTRLAEGAGLDSRWEIAGRHRQEFGQRALGFVLALGGVRREAKADLPARESVYR